MPLQVVDALRYAYAASDPDKIVEGPQLGTRDAGEGLRNAAILKPLLRGFHLDPVGATSFDDAEIRSPCPHAHGLKDSGFGL